jgi:hypothetical protein
VYKRQILELMKQILLFGLFLLILVVKWELVTVGLVVIHILNLK